MPELIAPTARLRESWVEAREEWGPEAHMAGSGTRLFEHYDLTVGDEFAAWVARLRQQSDPRLSPPGGDLVPSTFWWVVEGDQYVGSIDLRHRLNDFLAEAGGHIGYGIRPSLRRRGYASWALGAVLPHARTLGLGRVLLTCDEGNDGSARTIERNGGVLEAVRETGVGRKRRYWIDLSGSSLR